MKQNSYHKTVLFSLLVSALLCFNSISSFAQISVPVVSNGYSEQPIKSNFNVKEIVFSKGQILSNVLCITNISKEEINFSIDLTCPVKWKSLYKTSHDYTLQPNDSVFIPIRVIPMSVIKGNTKYLINAFIISDDGRQMANCYFFASTQKLISWEVDVEPASQIYFLNDVNVTPFSVGIYNNGNEEQDIQMELKQFGAGAMIMDTTGKLLKKTTCSFNLKSFSDTSFHYKMGYPKYARNYRSIDFESYTPFILEDETKYTLFVNTSVPKQSGINSFRKNKKLEFIKLGNYKKVNPYGSAVIPLTTEFNIYNILGSVPMMNINLYGNTILKGGFLYYQTNLTYFLNYASLQSLKNAPIQIGYFQKRWSLQFGEVGYGKGFAGTFKINDKHSLSGYLAKGPTLFGKTDMITTGLGYNWQVFDCLTVSAGIDHATYITAKTNVEGLRIGASYAILRQLSASVGLTEILVSMPNTTLRTVPGFNATLSYNDILFKERLKTQAGAYFSLNQNYYNSYYFTNSNMYSYAPRRMNFSLNNNYNHDNKWQIGLANNYSRYTNFYSLPGGSSFQTDDYQFSNQLMIPTFRQKSKINPYLFYNIIRAFEFTTHSRGLGVHFANFDYEKNTRYSVSLNMGYTRGIKVPDKKDYFFIQLSGMYQWRTSSIMAAYNYGNAGANYANFNGNYGTTKYPQRVSLSYRSQYILPNPRFVVEPRTSLAYSTITGFQYSLNPDIYYFIRSGWRFRLGLEYFYSFKANSTENRLYYYNSNNGSSDEMLKPSITNSFLISVGIKKDFGIPIPSKKKMFCTVDFIAFTDANGNKKWDIGEELLENVVIRVNGWEVLTDSKGHAKLENMNIGSYPYMVFSLVDLHGWFPEHEDSVTFTKTETKYIPYSRGVKIYGDIVVDREKYAALSNTLLDLSRIRITALDGQPYSTLTDNHGSYTLYIPYGKYILTMDENVLGEKFKLVQNNFDLTLNDSIDNLYIPFYIIEKKRKINVKKFNSAGQVEKTNVIENKSTIQNATPPVENENNNKDTLNKITNDSLNKTTPTTNDTLNKTEGNNGGVNDKDYSDMSEYRDLDSLVNKMLEKSNAPVTDSASLYKYNPNDTSGSNNLKHYNDLDSLISNYINESKPTDSKGVKEVLNIVAESKDFIQRFSNVKSIAGFYYTVQVGAFTKPVKPDDFKPIANLLYDFSKAKVIKVLSGMFTSYESADRYLKEVKSKGFPNAFITAYNNGVTISMQEAAKIAKTIKKTY